MFYVDLVCMYVAMYVHLLRLAKSQWVNMHKYYVYVLVSGHERVEEEEEILMTFRPGRPISQVVRYTLFAHAQEFMENSQ